MIRGAAEASVAQHALSHADLRDALVAWFGESLESVVQLQPLGAGHINSTWQVTTTSGEFVLQKLSTAVFPNPENLMANLGRLLAAAQHTSAFGYQLPHPLPSLAGDLLVVTTDHASPGYWRLCNYLANTRTLQTITNSAEAHAAGQAFGDFQRMARAVDPATLLPVIDRFLELEGYWQSLEASADACVDSSAALWAELKRRIDSYRAPALQVDAVIHGDCKVNNLLFSSDADTVSAVLDLDTVMTGAWWLDFGDLVRSAAFDASGGFVGEFYTAIAEGFFAGREGLYRTELDEALRAPAHLSFMLAVRFLDDHLRGDQYFRVTEVGDNLRRAQAQFEQVRKLEASDCMDHMRSCLQTCLIHNEIN